MCECVIANIKERKIETKCGWQVFVCLVKDNHILIFLYWNVSQYMNCELTLDQPHIMANTKENDKETRTTKIFVLQINCLLLHFVFEQRERREIWNSAKDRKQCLFTQSICASGLSFICVSLIHECSSWATTHTCRVVLVTIGTIKSAEISYYKHYLLNV